MPLSPCRRSALALRLLIISITLPLLASCAGPPPRAPIVDAAPIPSHRIKKHVVAPGETLYSIALRYDLDYKKISQINGLAPSHRIHSGQVLSLDTSAYRAPPKIQSKAQTAPPKTWEKAKPTAPPVSEKRTTRETPPPKVQPSSGSARWQWPLNGKVLESFNPTAGLNKGIDIQGKLGEPVIAAADGEVVYSGSGLRGYGNLLIVKHNENYLSAYGHNRVLHVAEGDKVTAGQKIAEVGFSGTNTAKLHFEIRLDGTPVDPLKYLPRR